MRTVESMPYAPAHRWTTEPGNATVHTSRALPNVQAAGLVQPGRLTATTRAPVRRRPGQGRDQRAQVVLDGLRVGGRPLTAGARQPVGTSSLAAAVSAT